MMLSVLSIYEQSRNDLCFLCSNTLSEIKSYPNVCDHFFHYKCLRNYVDNRLERNEQISCPICNKIFNQIGNRYKKSKEILFQNVILSSDETQCCICFSKYKCPVASTDTCTHIFCFECIKKWCTYKHECPMDRMPIKLLLMSDFPGGHITKKEEPPPIEQDLNGDGDNDEIINTTCEVCNLGNNDHLLLLCDNCNRGYHIYCLTSPLNDIPEGDWFCEQCSNDMAINNSHMNRNIPRFPRMAQNILPIDSTTQNRSNTTSRNQRVRLRSRRVPDDSDHSDIIETRSARNRSSTRSRPTPVGSSDEGVRRSLRNRRQISDEPEPVRNRRLPMLRNRVRRLIESDDEENDTSRSSLGSTTQNHNNSYSYRNSNNQTSTLSRSSLVNEESPSHRDDNNFSGRNRQGSLSSEPESEIEPTRRPMKIVESSTSESESSIANSSDAESMPRLQVTTAKRALDAIRDDLDDDCPIPRPVKRPRLINESSSSECVESGSEDSDDETVHDDQDETQDVIESELTQEEEMKSQRQRHISSSSSLSTIPCRISTRSNPSSNSTTPRPTPRYDDNSTDSSTSDDTDSDYYPYMQQQLSTPTLHASTSAATGKRSSVSQKKKTKTKLSTKRKSLSSKKKTSSIKRKSSSSKRKSKSRKGLTRKSRTLRNNNNSNSTTLQNNSELLISNRLSLFGRERQLPVVSDEELNIKHCPNQVSTEGKVSRTSNSNGNILSEIIEAQSNLRTISLSTISRQSDGTLIYKSHFDQFENRENSEFKRVSASTSSYQSNTQINKNHATSSQPTQSSTSTNTPMQCQMATGSSNRSILTTGPSNQIPDTVNSQIEQPSQTNPSVRPLASTVSESTSNSSATENSKRPKQTLIPTTSAASATHRESHITQIKKIIISCLRTYRDSGEITSEENRSLTDRIAEKITKGDSKRKMPGETSVKDFSIKYLDFYLRRRK